MSVQKKIAGIMFLDVKGYSKLTEPQLNRFFAKVLPGIGSLVNNGSPFYKNSWGDAVVAASDDVLGLTSAAVEIRDFFVNFNWAGNELPKLSARLSLHSGPLYVGQDPIQGADGIVGTQVNLAARIEPITLPNHVWATDNFISMLELESQDLFAWDDLGERQLAKEWGAKRLYRIRRSQERSELPSLTEASETSDVHSISNKIDLCRRLLTIGTEEQKLTALDMLGQVMTSESLTLLVTYAKKKEESIHVRQMALASLAEAKSQTVVPDLLDMIASPAEPEVIVGSVVEALGKLPDVRSFETLAAIVQGGENSPYNTRLRGVALQSLSRLRDSRAVPIIRAILQSGSHELISSAVGAAGLSKSKALSESLIDVACARTQYDPSIRGAAIEAIIIAGTGPMASVFDKAASIASDTNESRRVRLAGIDLVAMFENAASKKILADIAGRLDDDSASDALRALFLGEKLGKRRIESFDMSG